MTDDDNLVLAEMFPQIFGQFDAVLCHSINGHCGCHGFSSLPESPTSTPLIPLNYRKVPFPRSEEREGPGIRDVTRTAVQKQQHGIAAVLTANRHPLLDSANGDLTGLVNALCGRNRVVSRVAGSHKGCELFELAKFRVKGRGRNGRLLSFILLARSRRIQKEERKAGSKDLTKHERSLPDKNISFANNYQDYAPSGQKYQIVFCQPCFFLRGGRPTPKVALALPGVAPDMQNRKVGYWEPSCWEGRYQALR